MSIHEMLENVDANALQFVQDYRMNLIAPASMDDADFDKFNSTLKEVLSFIKYSKNKEKMEQILGENENFCHMGRDEVNVLKTCTNVKLQMKENEEDCDMCKAWEDMGRECEIKGRELGIAEGIAEGRAEGRAEERTNAISRMLSAGFTREQICSLGYTEAEIKAAV